MDIKSEVRMFFSPRNFRHVVSVLSAVSLVFVSGCATDPIPTGSRMMVSAKTAQFYKHGPAQDPGFQQATYGTMLSQAQDYGPDAQLPRGSSVTLLSREIGYSRVSTDDGRIGYVANDQMERAPAITRVTEPAAPTWKPGPGPRRHKTAPSRPPLEQLDLTDVPLPLPS
jgi:hypothetical protein